MTQQFIDRGHIKWREGNMKTSFIYLLIDPRISDNLPLQYKDNCEVDVWSKFIASIFYVNCQISHVASKINEILF